MVDQRLAGVQILAVVVIHHLGGPARRGGSEVGRGGEAPTGGWVGVGVGASEAPPGGWVRWVGGGGQRGTARCEIGGEEEQKQLLMPCHISQCTPSYLEVAGGVGGGVGRAAPHHLDALGGVLAEGGLPLKLGLQAGRQQGWGVEPWRPNEQTSMCAG